MYNYWAWRLIPTCGKIPLHLYVTVSFHSNWVTQPLTLPTSPARRRQWHPTPVLLPGKSHGWGSLEGCSPWNRWGSDTTERLHLHFSLSCIGEGNGNPLQCSCLGNPRDGGAWWAAVYGGRTESDTTEETQQQQQQLVQPQLSFTFYHCFPGHFLLAFLPQWSCLTSNLFPLFLRGWLFLCVLHSLPRSSEHIAIWRCPQTQTFPQGKPSRLQLQCKTTNIGVFFEAVLHFEPFKKQRWNRQRSWTVQRGRKCQGTER